MKNRIVGGTLAAIGIVLAVSVYLWPQLIAEIPIRLAPAIAALEPAPRVLFVGDIMLDRVVAMHANAVGDEQLFAGVRGLFGDANAVVGNLEGTITSMPSVSQASTTILRFTFAPRMADVLRAAGMSAVSVANNHAYDFGVSGYEETLANLERAGIAAFGSPLNDKNISTTLLVYGRKICLIGYMQLYDPNMKSVLDTLAAIRPSCDRLVVFAHWGVEYQHEPTDAQREAAHALVDAGVDVVIGAHPHVVEPVEIYHNRAIFYSLGNFIFDQGWKPEVRRGLSVLIEFGTGETTFKLTPVFTYEGASVADAATTAAVLSDAGVSSPTFVLKN